MYTHPAQNVLNSTSKLANTTMYVDTHRYILCGFLFLAVLVWTPVKREPQRTGPHFFSNLPENNTDALKNVLACLISQTSFGPSQVYPRCMSLQIFRLERRLYFWQKHRKLDRCEINYIRSIAWKIWLSQYAALEKFTKCARGNACTKKTN